MQAGKTGFLQDAEGNNSVMRLAFVWLILNATALSWYVLLTDATNVGGAAAIFGTVTGVATGLKIIQKQQEKSGEDDTKN